MCIRQVLPRAYLLSRQDDVILSFSFGAWSVQTSFICVQKREDFERRLYYLNFILFTNNFTSGILWRPLAREEVLGHAMSLFDSHTKCARCHEKRVGKDACV